MSVEAYPGAGKEAEELFEMGRSFLPPPKSTNSYWRLAPHWTDGYRSTEQLPAACDIAIIGSGLAGVSTAYHLLNDGEWPHGTTPSILLLEARETCSGATSRNGGHVRFGPSKLAHRITQNGYDETAEITEFVMQTMHAIKHVIGKENIACTSEYHRTLDVLLDAEEAEAARKAYDHLVEAGFPYMNEFDFINEEHAERVTSVKGAKAAVSAPVLSLNPYELVTQLLARALGTGRVNLQTHTPVLGVHNNATSRGTHIHTRRGTVRASKVVFATNSYTAGLLPQYRDVIIPIKAQAAHITIPSSGPLSQKTQYPVVPYLSSTYDINFGNGHSDYLNPRPDGTIVVGGGKWLYSDSPEGWHDSVDDSTLIGPVINHYFDGYMQRHFRGWECSGARVDHIWTGIVTESPDSLPHIGRVPSMQELDAGAEDHEAENSKWVLVGDSRVKVAAEEHYILAGFNGGGMSLIFEAGRCIAQMIRQGCNVEDTDVPRILQSTPERLRRLRKAAARRNGDSAAGFKSRAGNRPSYF